MPPFDAVELKAMVEGRSSTDVPLGRVFATLAAGFVAEAAPEVSTVIQWDVTTPQGTQIWHVVVAGGAVSVAEGPAGTPRVTLGLDLADLLGFLAGRLDGMEAFMSGRLRISGDLMVAQAMQAWFSPPAEA